MVWLMIPLIDFSFFIVHLIIDDYYLHEGEDNSYYLLT